MSTITKPMALDESFNTTESTPRNQADVLAAIEDAIRQGFGQVALAVEYDNTDSGLTAENVQDAIDEVDDTVDGLANDVAEISSDIESTQTATGNPLTLTDCAPINAESLKVELEPKQDLHGQSAPYVGGAGKNKADIGNSISDWFSLKNNGMAIDLEIDISTRVTAIIEPQLGRVTVTNYISTNWRWMGRAIPLKKNTNYVVSGNISGYIYVEGYNSLEDSASGTIIRDGLGTFNSGDYNYYVLAIYPVGSNEIIANSYMIEEGSTATTFAPYSNICPITGYTECNVDDVGKNRVDISETTISSSDYVFNLTNLNIPQGTYTFSFDCTEDGNASFAGGDDNTDFVNDPILVRGGKGAITFIATNMITQMRLYGYAATYSNFQLEEGSIATTYEPYQSTSATIQFGQTVYGGVSDFVEGGTDDEIAFIKDTHITNISEGVDGNADWLNVVFTTDINILPSDTVEHRQELAERSTSNYSGVWEYENVNGHVHFYSGGAGSILAFYPKSVFPTLSDFTTYYANNKAEFAIPYDTASTIATPPTELKLLKGTNNLSADGVMQIGYQPDNVIGDAKEKADKINNSEIVKYTISGNTADLIPLVIDGTGHNDIPIVTDITKYRMLCVELVLKPSTAIMGVYFSAIAFTDGIYLPSGISIPVYIPSEKFYANITINPDGNGGFKLSYVAINQSQSTPPDYYAIRVRAFNQY